MDFGKIKDKLQIAKNKTIEIFNKTIEKGASKLIESDLTVKTLFDLDNFIHKSKNSYNTETGKDIIKKIICIFASKESDFFKKSLYLLPIIYTKGWTNNIPVKLIDSNIEGLELNKFEIETIPSLVLIENEKVIKVVAGEEKINKIVTNLSLDIEKTVTEKKKEQKEEKQPETNKESNNKTNT
ncbi:MAG: hypothetical protein PHN31_03040 [Candidatus Gracilibacteria bacterium]|nr:hypothetical protein [Candidatus Gracilibacteria bacterium]